MGVKKRKDVPAPAVITLSEKSWQFLTGLSTDDPLWSFLQSADLQSQLAALKLVTTGLCKGDPPTEQSKKTIELLLDAYWNLPVKNQLTKALTGSLVMLSASWPELIFGKLREAVIQKCAVDVALSCNNLKDIVLRFSMVLDNFKFDENLHHCNSFVFCFLSRCLQHYVMEISVMKTLANEVLASLCQERFWNLFLWSYPLLAIEITSQNPTDRNTVMTDILLLVQTLNKIIQKFISQNIDSSVQDGKNNQLLSAILDATNNIYAVLLDDNFMVDCHTAAGMYFPLLIRWCAQDHLLAQTTKYLIGMDVKGDSDLLSSDLLVKCLEGKDLSELPIESRICLLNGILAVFDVPDLIADREEEEKCFLVDCLGRHLILLMPRVAEKNAKLVYSRSLVLLATKTRLVTESISASEPLRRQLHGSASLPSELVRYSRLHWDDPVDVIRHQARVIFEQVIGCHLATTKEDSRQSPFLLGLMTSLMEMDWSLKSKYGPLSCLVNAVGASTFLCHSSDLPQVLLAAIRDQTMACHVGEFIEKLYVRHFAELGVKPNVEQENAEDEKKFYFWSETWVDPILEFLICGNESQKSSVIEYIVPNLLLHCPRSLYYICAKLTSVDPLDDGRLGALITCLKYAKSGGIVDIVSHSDIELLSESCRKESLLKLALCHTTQQIRLDALGLLCEHNKTTEVVRSCDLDLIRFFLPLNLSNQTPAFRQHLVAILKKLFVRLRDSGQMLLRQCSNARNKNEDAIQYEESLQCYRDFFHFLCNLCFGALRPGASFPIRTTALAVLSMLCHIIGTDDRKGEGCVFYFVDAVTSEKVLTLVNCLNDTFEQNKKEAFCILTSLPERCLQFLDGDGLLDLFSAGVQLAQSPRPQDCTTAAYLLRFLLHAPQILPLLETQLKSRVLSGLGNCALVTGLNRKRLCLTEVLLDLLQDEVKVASSNLMLAAATRPMYPTLHCIRYIFADISYSHLEDVAEWRHLMSRLIDICFSMAVIVAPIVTNSSPEGNIPFDLESLPAIPEADCDLSFQVESDETSASGTVLDLEEKVRLMPEYLVVCGWRSIKEVSLILGQLTSTVPLFGPDDDQQSGNGVGLLSIQQLHSIGTYFTQQLLESRHRGAFELAYAGFVQMTERLWNCTLEGVHELPRKWLEEVISKVRVHDPCDQLCSTRRSAGVPFYIQALVTTEPLSSGRRSFKLTMSELLSIASQPVNEENTAQVHARNILRALFRDTRLGEDVFPYIADGIRVAILGYGSYFWPVRNSSTLLFSSLITRIFGVKPTHGDQFRRNYLTGRVFFSRFPSLFEFLLNQLQEATQESGSVSVVQLHPGVYPVLMILGRLCPSVAEGSSSTLNLEQLLPFIISCAGSAVYKIRYMAAQAICPLVTKEKMADTLLDLLQRLPMPESMTVSQNLIHGLCIQLVGQVVDFVCPQVSFQHPAFCVGQLFRTSVADLKLTMLEPIIVGALMENVSSLPKSLQLDVARAVVPQLIIKQWILSIENPCLLTRLAFAEIVGSVVHALWPTDLEESVQSDLLHLGRYLMSQLKAEVLVRAHPMPDVSSIPGHLQYLCRLSSIAFDCLCDSRFFDPSVLLALIKRLATSESYDFRIEAVRFINSTLRIHESGDESDEMQRRRGCSACQNAVMKQNIIDCVTGSTEIGNVLFQMVLAPERSSKCLAMALKALKLFYVHLTSSSDGEFLRKSWSISRVQQVLHLLHSCQRDEIRIATVGLLNQILPILFGSVAKEQEVQADGILSDICDSIDSLTQAFNDPDLRLSCCQMLIDNALLLLMDVNEILGQRMYKMWTVLFRLLQDEDCLVRETASKAVVIFKTLPTAGIQDQTLCSVQSNFAAELSFEVFINIHNSGWKAWLPGGLSTLLDWLLNDVEPACSEEEDIRLFDRGEMNTYGDELWFVLTIAAHLKLTIPEILRCFARLQDGGMETERTRELTELFTKFTGVVDEAESLLQSFSRSPSAPFLQNSKYVGSATKFVRKATAAIWLEEILQQTWTIPETTALKLAKIKTSALTAMKLS